MGGGVSYVDSGGFSGEGVVLLVLVGGVLVRGKLVLLVLWESIIS